ncbi:hypothetical protein X729_31080 [Mesorhizobium sp. L103C131B0]|nr:hypothetical protein X729_31080 [Mesorhizobium sp. L103C131B0]
MFRFSAKLPCGRYLSFAEREEIAILRVQGLSMRNIGRRLGRSASTISRELRRNAATCAAVAWSIVRRLPNGTPSDQAGARRLPSLR